ncbi:MAG: aldo/keto reductase [Propionibacteriaceae bacterium]|jgi:aryl-alcohol dehydrogenase-like predicted oxidoreductase|nr:aldo/keto reductase [Propionibacteriaceae bacterium]
MTQIAFGTWEFGGTYGPLDPAEAVNAVHRAIDLGVTVFDTARIYGLEEGKGTWRGAGRSEQLLGKALQGRRDKVQIVTKGGVSTRAGQPSHRAGQYNDVLKDVDISLADLGTDYIDLYLIHWPDRETPREETMAALNHCLDQGKVRYVGVSNFDAELLREVCQYAPIAVNQVGFNLFDRRWERHMFPTAQELGVSIMAYGPLCHGLLTGTWSADTEFPDPDWRRSRVFFGQSLLTPENFGANLAVVDQLRMVADGKGITLPQLALAWVFAHPQIAVGIVGARTPVEIEEDVKAADITFTDAELARIDQIMAAAQGQIDQVPR